MGDTKRRAARYYVHLSKQQIKIIVVAAIAIMIGLMTILIVIFTLRTAASFSQGNARSSISLAPPLLTLTTPANKVDPAFIGLAVEARSLIYYAGTKANPNTFSQNLIGELSKRTDSTISIRVGGTSLDHSTYNTNQAAAVTFPPGESLKNVPNDLHFGPSYFSSYAQLAPAQYTLDIPLVPVNSLNSIEFARQAYNAVIPSLPSRSALTLQVGNEPNLYPGRERSTSYNPAAHVAEWAKRTSNIATALGLGLNTPMWQFGTLATGKEITATPWSAIPRDSWTMQDMFKTGGLTAYIPRIKSVSMHYYQTISRASAESSSSSSPSRSLQTQLQHDLMNHTALISGLADVVAATRFMAAAYPRIPLVLDEVNSALNLHAAPGGTVNNDALEGVVGAALWTANLLFYCMAQGIARVQLQQGIGFGFAAWLPVTYKGVAPRVRAPYYGMLFAADFLGPTVAGGTTVTQLQLNGLTPGSQSDTLVAYGAYSSGRLQRIAILNMKFWSAAEELRSGVRGSQTIKLGLGQGFGAPKAVEVWRLASSKGATAEFEQDITWAGSRWTAGSNGMEVQGVVDDRKVYSVGLDGSVQIAVNDSEGVLVNMKY